MKEFKKVNKTFIKSNNSTTKIYNRYLYCLIPFVFLIIFYNLIWGSSVVVINLLKNIFISLIISIITAYLINILKKEKTTHNILFKDNLLTISIIISLFSINTSPTIVIIATIISIIIRKIFKNTTISSSLYGILFILITLVIINHPDTPLSNLSKLSYIGTYDDLVKPYGTLLSYSLGLNYYLSPILAIISFIYLFYKKSIKYNLVFSYILTISIIMLSLGLLNHMSIWYLFFQLTTGNLLFLTIFCLTDYQNTPLTYEGQIIYGIILGIVTCILRFIIPELSVVISLILGPLVLTKFIDKLSTKLKYNRKFYNLMLSICIILLIITTIILNVLI